MPVNQPTLLPPPERASSPQLGMREDTWRAPKSLGRSHSSNATSLKGAVGGSHQLRLVYTTCQVPLPPRLHATIGGAHAERASNFEHRGAMSGHSKWKTIKHQKGVADAKRSQVFTKYGRNSSAPARKAALDPENNPRLRLAIDRAREQNMPKDNIERAI